jgi:hypothetical protein
MSEVSTINRFAVMLLPTEVCLAWLQSCPEGDAHLTLEELQREPTVFLIPEGRADPETYIRRHYRTMFEEELHSWYTDPELWTKDLSFKNFKRFFTIVVSSVVFDLGSGEIARNDEDE